ncbi:hypothetical protein [Halarcobacter sp.]|nr:hypothetical protein [Halarcobacter sp.]
MRIFLIITVFVSIFCVLKITNKVEEKRLTNKEDVNLIFSSIHKENLDPL